MATPYHPIISAVHFSQRESDKIRMKNSCVSNFLILCGIIGPSVQQKLVEDCGIKLDDITKTISSSDTKSNFAPWVVSIGFGEEIMDEYEPHCTGTIIKGWTSKRPFLHFSLLFSRVRCTNSCSLHNRSQICQDCSKHICLCSKEHILIKLFLKMCKCVFV